MKIKNLITSIVVTTLYLYSYAGNATTKNSGSSVPKKNVSIEKSDSQTVELKKNEPVAKGDSNGVQAIMSQAKEYIQNKKYKLALPDLLKAKTINPNDSEIRKLLVTVYHESGNMGEEAKELKELIEIKPDNNFRVQHARVLRKMKKYDDAKNVIEDIRAVDPENIKALFELGFIYQEQKMYKEALETFKEITFIDVKNFLAKYHQAEVCFVQNKPLWAEKYYNDVLVLNPKFGLAELGLAKIAKLRNSKENYQSHIIKAYELSPDIPEIKEAYNRK